MIGITLWFLMGLTILTTIIYIDWVMDRMTRKLKKKRGES